MSLTFAKPEINLTPYSISGFDYLAKVITGVQFKDGIEQSDDAGSDHSSVAA